MRWAIDIAIVIVGRYTLRCGDNGRGRGDPGEASLDAMTLIPIPVRSGF
jgi:hypothetical protein